MKRTTNFSRKKVIKHSLVKVTTKKEGKTYFLNSDIGDLPSVSSEHDVAIFLRVRADAKVWRKYYLGTIDQVENLENEIFPDIEEGRTKVVQCILALVEQSGSREIKAISKKLTIQKFRFDEDDEDITGESESNYSLVTVDYDREDRLGNVPWLIDITSETTIKPNLILNKNFLENELKQKIFTGSGIAQTLILVQIIRDVLKYLLIQQNFNIQNIDTYEGWQKIWLMWAKEMSSEDYPQTDNVDIITHWIEDLLDEYCRKKKLIQLMKSELAGS